LLNPASTSRQGFLLSPNVFGWFTFVQRHDGKCKRLLRRATPFRDAVGVYETDNNNSNNNNNSLFLNFESESFSQHFPLFSFRLKRAKCGRSIPISLADEPLLPLRVFTMMRKLRRQLMNFTLRRLRRKKRGGTGNHSGEKEGESRASIQASLANGFWLGCVYNNISVIHPSIHRVGGKLVAG